MRCIFYHRDKQGKIINGGGFANPAKAKAKPKKKPKKPKKDQAEGSSCVAVVSDAVASGYTDRQMAAMRDLYVPTHTDGSDAVASATATGALQQSPLEQ